MAKGPMTSHAALIAFASLHCPSSSPLLRRADALPDPRLSTLWEERQGREG